MDCPRESFSSEDAGLLAMFRINHLIAEVTPACRWRSSETFPVRAQFAMSARAHQELDPEEHVLVVCYHCVRSMNVPVWLRQQRFEKTQSMRSGIDAWSRRVDGKVPVD